MSKPNPTPNLFQGFSEDEALKILQKAKVQKEKKERKTSLQAMTTDGIVFVQAGKISQLFTDKPDIFCLGIVNPTNNTLLEPLYKHKTFFKTLASFCKGSKLAEVITATIPTT